MKLSVGTILLVLSSHVFCQGKYDANWAFGVKAGINFNNAAHPVNFQTLCNNYNAAAAISDSLGNLLFYIAPDTPFFSNTDYGTINAIYNSNNEVIPNGDSINTGIALESAVFLPIPQARDSFYAFYIHNGLDVINIYYSVIVKNDSGNYKVAEKNVVLSNLLVEWTVTAIKHANGHDWWLLLHEWDADSATSWFYKYLVTRDTIIGPFLQNIGSVHDSPFGYFSSMKASGDGQWLAVTLDDENKVDLFNFNRCTGLLENYVSLDNIDTTGNCEIDNCEFSGNNKLLYASEGAGDISTKSGLYQFSLDSPDINSSKTTIFKTDSIQTIFGNLLRAPDNKIYLAVEYNRTANYTDTEYNQFNQYLWVINDPDSSGSACNFQPYGYYLGDSERVYWGLPNMPNYNLGPLSIYQAGAGTDTVICSGDTTNLTIGLPPVPGVTYQWKAAPGITDVTQAQQTVKPDSSTWYYVTLTDTTIKYSCQSRMDSVYVQVINCCDSLLLSQCTLSKDTFICTDKDTPTKGVILFATAPQGIVLTWHAGIDIDSLHASEQIVDPPQSTQYYVTFTDTTSSGSCNSKTDSVYVKVETCLGIEEINGAMRHLNIYPNPAQNTVVVEWQPVDGQLELSVTDLLGREIQFIKVDGISGTTEMDISALANGLYVVRLLSSFGGSVGGGKLAVVK